jgi:hypothetical protein
MLGVQTIAYEKRFVKGAGFKTPYFGQSQRWAQFLILEILNVLLRLKFSPTLTLTKLKRFESGSKINRCCKSAAWTWRLHSGHQH